jgi:hypothetical protein
MTAEIFAAHALKDVPKLLMLQDRNPHSPVYGCFDRNYWQYRIVDFPTGMAQEFVYPLALAYTLNIPGNRYCGDAALREWIEAGIRFAADSAHADGSCDDFFPYERASGAAAFSLLACMEAYTLLEMDDPALLAFFEKRGRWLAEHQESGRLSNHEALIAFCLYLLADRFGVADMRAAYESRLDRLLSWQHAEGWFAEYEGCDLGYQTLTIAMLAELFLASGDEKLRDPLTRAVAMTAEFMHPDGSFGGEYSSRNTYNYFPHGFERLGSVFPEGLAMNDAFLGSIEAGNAPCYSDDHMIAHHLWSYLLAAKHFVTERPVPPARTPRAYFPAAGLLADRRGDSEIYIALNKGGVFKAFRGGRLVLSDTQLSFKLSDGRTAVCHMIDDYAVAIEEGRIEVAGSAGWAKQKLMGLRDNLLLRGFMLVFGRFFPDLVRSLLQKMLITGKQAAPFRFERVFGWRDGGWTVTDRVVSDQWRDVVSAGIGGHQTSIFVIQSRPYQPGQHQLWHDLGEEVRALAPGERLEITRYVD